jgi:hypothetical protein
MDKLVGKLATVEGKHSPEISTNFVGGKLTSPRMHMLIRTICGRSAQIAETIEEA